MLFRQFFDSELSTYTQQAVDAFHGATTRRNPGTPSSASCFGYRTPRWTIPPTIQGLDGLAHRREKRDNPRLAQTTRTQYIERINGLVRSNPRLMDVAIPANLRAGN